MKKRTILVLAASLLSGSVLSSSAADKPDARGCFTRTYDRAHLARHPDQRVTKVTLHIHPSPYDPTKTLFGMHFRVRGKNEPLFAGGKCQEEVEKTAESPPGTREKFFWYCYSYECDAGGGVNVVPRARDAMMYLKGITVISKSCSAGWLSGGKDDRVFRLNRVNAAACKELDND
jgi:hypothetical protein